MPEKKKGIKPSTGRNLTETGFAPASQGMPRSWSGMVEAGKGDRADKYIAETAGILSRSQLKAREAVISVNGRKEKPSCRLVPGDLVEVSWTDEPDRSLEAERLDVEILYEDGNVFVFNKAQGMVTHPANGHWRGTLANAALWLDADRRGGGSAPRGGIVHRLDKDTSGVIILARNTETHEFLAAQFKNRTTRKEYWAIVCPAPAPDEGHIENYLARDRNNRKKFAPQEAPGKRAVTDYKVLARWSVEGRRSYALMALYPKTGRTHQLRVHMQSLGCPILGDPLYGRKDPLFPDATLMLHARRLKIALPGVAEPMLFKATVPSRFRTIVAALERSGTRG